jgi:biotin transporter BioY
MNQKKYLIFQTGATIIGVLNFPSLGFIWLRFVSDFDIWILGFVLTTLPGNWDK